MTTLTVTGHRPPRVGGYDLPNPIHAYVTRSLRTILTGLAPDLVYVGMALGVDQWAAAICIDLGIPFVAAVPFVGQEFGWPEASRVEYRRLLAHAHEVVHVSPPGYAAWKMHARDRWMVDRGDRLVAVWDGGPEGGTAATVAYAMAKGKTVFRIDPRDGNVAVSERDRI